MKNKNNKNQIIKSEINKIGSTENNNIKKCLRKLNNEALSSSRMVKDLLIENYKRSKSILA